MKVSFPIFPRGFWWSDVSFIWSVALPLILVFLHDECNFILLMLFFSPSLICFSLGLPCISFSFAPLFFKRIMPNFQESATDFYKTHDLIHKFVKLTWSSSLYLEVDIYLLSNERVFIGFDAPLKGSLYVLNVPWSVKSHPLMLRLICLTAVLSITWSLFLVIYFYFSFCLLPYFGGTKWWK